MSSAVCHRRKQIKSAAVLRPTSWGGAPDDAGGLMPSVENAGRGRDLRDAGFVGVALSPADRRGHYLEYHMIGVGAWDRTLYDFDPGTTRKVHDLHACVVLCCGRPAFVIIIVSTFGGLARRASRRSAGAESSPGQFDTFGLPVPGIRQSRLA